MGPVSSVVVLAFVSAFIVAALLMAASQAGASKALRETLTRLDSVTLPAKRANVDEFVLLKREELLSSIPWFDRWLRGFDFFGRLRLLLRQADANWTVGGLVACSLGCWALAATLLYLRTSALVPAVLLGAVASTIPWMLLLRKRTRRFETFEAMLPEALDLIVSALRAGHGLNSAIGAVAKEMSGPIAVEFRQCFDEQNFGLELRTAMLNMAARVPIQDVKIIVTAILVQKESGGNLAEVLNNVATIIRERFRLKQEIRTRTAQGRLTGWILGCLPVVLGSGLYLANPEYVSILWTHPTGLKMLYGAAVLTVIGTLIIRKIVRVRV
jgi:tight adherence protein B